MREHFALHLERIQMSFLSERCVIMRRFQQLLRQRETGHLVLSTLHTTGAAKTVDRIIDVSGTGTKSDSYSAGRRIKVVVTQCLVPLIDGGRIAATEVLTGTDAVLSQIREGKTHQLGSVMQSGAAAGMHTLDYDLAKSLFHVG